MGQGRSAVLPANHEPSTAQAAFSTTYSIPRVSTIAVGSDDPAHLSELLDALDLPLNEHAADAYRNLLRDRQPPQPAGSSATINAKAGAAKHQQA
ncbi:hypothetical protein [Streptomyces wuyuanensis]|uniref:hypothetical protein n=1 Tax=Streptomyces wuyuanensis TaxID=1196353 RepID=UPI003438CA74